MAETSKPTPGEFDDVRDYALEARRVKERAGVPKPKCPICGETIRQPFGHFFKRHSKDELVLLICKLLKLRPF